MKKLILFCMAIVASFAGCKKSENVTYSMKATINGTVFSTTDCTKSIVGPFTSIFGKTATETIEILVYSTAVNTATYGLDSISRNHQAYYHVIGTSVYMYAQNGSVTFTSVNDKNLSGTFSFVCSNSTRIENGSFTAKVQ